eukprot:359135_1
MAAIWLKQKTLYQLIHGYVLIMIFKTRLTQIVPHCIISIINEYLQKSFFAAEFGKNMTIKRNDQCIITMHKNQNEWNTAYCNAELMVTNKYEYICKFEIISSKRFHTDFIIGITSNSKIWHKNFTKVDVGYHYSYSSDAYIGVNDKWTDLDYHRYSNFDNIYHSYGSSDTVTIKLNLRDNELMFFKNERLVHAQINIHSDDYHDYRFAIAINGSATIQVHSIERVQLKPKKVTQPL